VPDRDGYVSDLARELAGEALERFLRYVRIDTRSDPHSDDVPSTAKQLDLSRLLVEELRELGLDDVELTGEGIVMATIPATGDREVPAVGLIAHVDTSPELSGENVRPQVVRYEGGELPLPADPSQVLRPDDLPELADHVGHELVTADGTTLLGADDKAGVAEIMAAAAYLVAHPELEHGPIRLGFTPDEEIGAGTDHFELDRFGAVAAYTLDGSTAGEIEDETFAALQATVTFVGRNTHPGTAKGVMVNAIKLAADFVASLPRDGLSPETTDGRDGFVHPIEVDGAVDRTVVRLILRSFDEDELAGHERLVRELAEAAAAGNPVELELTRQYRNMKEYLRDHPHVVEAAEEAARRAGLEPKRAIIRGGTDGSRLSEKGLPTPNVFTGGHAYHSKREWVCVADMGAAAATIVQLAQVWAEHAGDE
jgi:tripeptide aminopeptidase